MKTFTIAKAYTDADNKPLKLFVRFDRRDRVVHVAHRASATPFLTREEAEESCPRGYYVDPKAKPKRTKKVGPRTTTWWCDTCRVEDRKTAEDAKIPPRCIECGAPMLLVSDHSKRGRKQ